MILNVANRHADGTRVVDTLPGDMVIEVGCTVDDRGVRPDHVAEPTLAQLGLMARVRASERCILQAALTGSRDKAWEGFALHPCPHHEGLAAHADAASTDPHGADEAHPHEHHHAEGDRGGDPAPASGDCHAHGGAAVAPDGDSHDEHAGPCTCGSACQATAGVAMPSLPGAPPVDVVVAPQRSLLPAMEAPALGWPPYFLPLAQAPPTAG